MPRMGLSWQEAGFDTGPPPREPVSRRTWMEIYVGRCYGRLAELKTSLPEPVWQKVKAWMLDPNWINGGSDG